MFELIYRFDPDAPGGRSPRSAAAARKRLEDGNREFAGLSASSPARIITLNAQALGLARADGSPPIQKPFAVVLGCADARVPIELIFGQAANDLFVVRVAGNVLGAECLGSIDYAVTNLGESLRMLVVLGHSGCGAVTAAVKAFMDPHTYLDFATSHPLRAVIERIMVAVRSAHRALEQVYSQDVEEIPGYATALLETSVVMNAAMTAATVRQEFREKIGPQLDVAYGVYNLATRRVKLSLEDENDITVRLASPPTDSDGFDKLGVLIAGSGMIRRLLRTES
ncbi:carbonic anhydrase [Limnoglobus roseus]|uniref:Carbonic anhydrase n=1 Tax=Limnoglobus roseus TaxID=2598579 RepID=A0A5C1A5W6_9BACT|nr:carbonic anhydrase [Limnoglobus roseus]QEL13745.1 carbonic anhydrase [Limnoglobus roseus]